MQTRFHPDQPRVRCGFDCTPRPCATCLHRPIMNRSPTLRLTNSFASDLIMRLAGRRTSSNVEDRRSMRGPVAIGGGLGTIVLAIFVMLLGGNPLAVVQNAPQVNVNAPAGGGNGELSAVDQQRGEFSSQVLALTEDVWGQLFPQWSGVDPNVPSRYQPPTMVLFSQQVRSGCGVASAATGPFYCPADQKVYLDTQFFDVMERRLGAPGDFAQAYVIAHEVGHHIQKLLGATDVVERARRQLSEAEANQYSVRLELQADFYAGVMFHHSQRMAKILERGDIEEGLNAAAAIGDDKLQRESQGYARQESFTHGTSAQRVRWFKSGLSSGDPTQGDTFRIAYERL